MLGPRKKNLCVPITCQKNLGSVGRDFFRRATCWNTHKLENDNHSCYTYVYKKDYIIQKAHFKYCLTGTIPNFEIKAMKVVYKFKPKQLFSFASSDWP